MCPAPESFGIAYKIPSLIISKRASIRILKGLFLNNSFRATSKPARKNGGLVLDLLIVSPLFYLRSLSRFYIGIFSVFSFGSSRLSGMNIKKQIPVFRFAATGMTFELPVCIRGDTPACGCHPLYNSQS